jgi:hypothetical protein
MSKSLLLGLTVGLCLGWAASGASAAVTQEAVTAAVEKARENLLSLQGGGGFWPDEKHTRSPNANGESEMAIYTLIYTAAAEKNPMNDEKISQGLDAIISRELAYTYGNSMRCIALSLAQR